MVIVTWQWHFNSKGYITSPIYRCLIFDTNSRILSLPIQLKTLTLEQIHNQTSSLEWESRCIFDGFYFGQDIAKTTKIKISIGITGRPGPMKSFWNSNSHVEQETSDLTGMLMNLEFSELTKHQVQRTTIFKSVNQMVLKIHAQLMKAIIATMFHA